MRPAVLLGFLLLSFLAPTGEDRAPPTGERKTPLTPEQEHRTFRLPAGLRIELVACEPQVVSPVALAFDERGRLWVVEMLDYPNGPPRGKPFEGRIKILEDRDGDGRYETARVFAEGLPFANGLLPWKDGVLVTAAPHIVWLRDIDGDGKADRREVLYEGFQAENPQLRVSHPALGLDGWVHVANGLRGGQVRRAGQSSDKPIPLAGMDFRFDLVRDRQEAISGMGQYGNCFDDWGRRFVCDNRHHLRHIVLADRYLKRNPTLAVARVLEDVSELEEGQAGAGGKIYPLSKNWTTSNLHAGRFTAACSVFIYRGELLPQELQGAALTCDPTGNLVHAESLRPRGPTFRGKPLRDGVEFLASPDDWFRPVFLAHGPDDALYVVDMYRAVIEHPQFMPPELKNRPDLTLGKDRGRIWRIVPEKHRHPKSFPDLSRASLAELARMLGDGNAWKRTTAQRLLVQKHDRAAIAPLRQVLAGKSARARVQAAWLLERLEALREEELLALLQDEHPRVREQAVLLAEPRLAKSAKLQEAVLRLARDEDAGVRFQTALSLGEWPDERTLPALAAIARRDVEDSWMRQAVASAVPGRAGALLAALLKSSEPGSPTLIRELAALAGARQDAEEVGQVLAALAALRDEVGERWRLAALTGLAEGLGRRGGNLARFLAALPSSRGELARNATAALEKAAALASDPRRDPADRAAATALLAHVPFKSAAEALVKLLGAKQPLEVRLAAIRALSAHSDASVPGLLVRDWKTFGPALRREAVEALTRGRERTVFLLEQIEKETIKPGDLDANRTRQLIAHRDPAVRDRARKLLARNLPADRKEVLARYRAALEGKGDIARGRKVFEKNCATCHRVDDLGVNVGPDISDTRTKTAEMLLTDILNPNQAIDANFVNYQVTTRRGQVLTGIIVAETASSVTLKRAENQTDVVLRQDIEEIVSTGVSLMPEGVEKAVSIDEMRDLLAFLKNWRYRE